MAADSLLFVYGSLMRGFQHHGVLGNAAFVSVARTEPRWALLDLGHFPAVVPGRESIEGELYTVDSPTLVRLDRLEGCPDFYRRDVVTLSDGRQAATYLLQPGAFPAAPVVIPGGSWRRWCERRPS